MFVLYGEGDSHQTQGSQSLFHQVCVRSRPVSGHRKAGLASQSLFHQVCVRSKALTCLTTSSLSQSLFHQVCVRSGGGVSPLPGCSRNPFFIRSVFVLGCTPGRGGGSGSQSLFHQVCVRSFRSGRTATTRSVAIPFSSGLCSFPGRAGFVHLWSGRNPFFIRSVFVRGGAGYYCPTPASQSLFHQVCVRSLHQCGFRRCQGSQSLFHQVCVRSFHSGGRRRRHRVAIPFSSGLCSFPYLP